MKLVICTTQPCDGAVPQGGDLYLVPDGADLEAGAVELDGVAVLDAFPERTDLSLGHPLFGRRLLRSVPAGMPDIEVSDLGKLSTATAVVVEP